MRTVVTGGTGVVGTAVVRHLVAAGYTVSGLSRGADGDAALGRIGCEPIRGDILDGASLASAFAGADLVFHVAGLNTMCPRDPTRLDRVNVDGAREVMRAARRAGVRRVVHTSSAAAIGEEPGTIGTESSPHRGWYLSHYERSKHLGELAVGEEADGVEVVCVNPSSVQGPGRATGTGALILDLLRGRLPALIDTRLSIVDIDDCARGHLAAAERGVPGERYLLNSFTVSMRGAVTLLEGVVGHSLSVRWIPAWLAMIGAAGVETAGRLMRRQPPVCREMVRTLRHGHAYDGSRARAELGIDYASPEDLLTRLVDWFRSEGML
ncbi:MAG TPA: NAD-dependent epimerase/dehydratase family protein [Acidimicrobiia bacterium]|nr:NAD-dependent epimerase/dehydratase family protein [Acidimicrobiia bacterium]